MFVRLVSTSRYLLHLCLPPFSLTILLAARPEARLFRCAPLGSCLSAPAAPPRFLSSCFSSLPRCRGPGITPQQARLDRPVRPRGSFICLHATLHYNSHSVIPVFFIVHPYLAFYDFPATIVGVFLISANPTTPTSIHFGTDSTPEHHLHPHNLASEETQVPDTGLLVPEL